MGPQRLARGQLAPDHVAGELDPGPSGAADPAWWTQTIAFTAAAGHVRGE